LATHSVEDHPIAPHLFRGYSIRGVAERDLTDDVAVRVGRAIGTYFTQHDARTLVVGRDARTSSPRISRALVRGFLEAGLAVTDVGMVPTPVHNFATDLYQADGGVMVTASHNPPEYNGLKVRSHRTLNAADLQDIYRIATAAPMPVARPTLDGSDRLLAKTGDYRQADPLPTYLASVKAAAALRRPFQLVVDGGHGTNGPVVSQLLQELGCQVVELHCAPEGRFPERDPDPTAPGATKALASAVRRAGADIGLAFDGDGDRLVVVDEEGHRVLGDQILMILARDVLSHGPARIAYEILCTQALADDIIAHGGQPIVTPTGYAFVHEAMQTHGAALGGELSGHLFFDQPGFRFDDAILGAVKLLGALSRDDSLLSDVVAALPAYHSSPPIRLACPDPIKAEVVERLKVFYRRDWPVDELDGVRVDFGDGWALVRASNTQPALSLRFEARSEQRLAEMTDTVMKQVELVMSDLTSPPNPLPLSACGEGKGVGVRYTKRVMNVSRTCHRLAVVILAAGQGKRMTSDLPKVLHALNGRPMIEYALGAARTLHPTRSVVVVGHKADQVRAALGASVTFAEQRERMGTGHAVMQAQQAAQGCDAVLVLYGDMPLLRAATLQALWQRYQGGSSPLAMLIVSDSVSRGFGRILRDSKGKVQAIVEEADCTPEQLAIQELNPGVYCFDAQWLWRHLPRLPLHPGKGERGEYFITDLVAMAVGEGYEILDLVTDDPNEALGINTPEHLVEAEAVMRRRHSR
jgi:phosphomannomutase/phosphoglucomutase